MNIGFNFKSPAALDSIFYSFSFYFLSIIFYFLHSVRVSLSLLSIKNCEITIFDLTFLNYMKDMCTNIYTHTHISFLVFSLLTDVYVLSRVWLCATPETEAHQVPLSMEFLGKNTRVGCYSLLQGIFPTQGSNLHLSHLLHWQENSLPLCYLGSPLLKYAFIYLYIAFSVCQNHDKLGSLNLDYKHLLRNS